MTGIENLSHAKLFKRCPGCSTEMIAYGQDSYGKNMFQCPYCHVRINADDKQADVAGMLERRKPAQLQRPVGRNDKIKLPERRKK